MSVRPWYVVDSLSGLGHPFFYDRHTASYRAVLVEAHWHRSTPRGLGHVVWCQCSSSTTASSFPMRVCPLKLRPLTVRAAALLVWLRAARRLFVEGRE